MARKPKTDRKQPVPKGEASKGRQDPLLRGWKVKTYPLPKAGFDPLTATEKQLARHGFPPRPDRERSPGLHQIWHGVLSPRLKFVEPKLKPRPEGRRIGLQARAEWNRAQARLFELSERPPDVSSCSM
jgi:hypothetical protein